MTFQFRDDVEQMSKSQLVKYVEQLETRVQIQEEHAAGQGAANLISLFGLTPSEAALLEVLADGRPHEKRNVVSQMCAHRPDDEPEAKIVDVFVCKIRRKLAQTPIRIETIWGFGYQVKDTAPLKAAMAGEKVEGAADPTVRVGRPVGGVALPHGAVTTNAIAFLKSRANEAGDIYITARDFSEATGNRTAGASMIRNLEKGGHIEVIAKSPVRGGVWVLRVVER